MSGSHFWMLTSLMLLMSLTRVHFWSLFSRHWKRVQTLEKALLELVQQILEKALLNFSHWKGHFSRHWKRVQNIMKLAHQTLEKAGSANYLSRSYG